MVNCSLVESFKNALSGLAYAFLRERNIKLHLLAAIFVIFFALRLDFSRMELIVLFFTIFLVFVAELFNTAVEAVVDLFTEEFHELARKAKNVAAGAVLLTCINALVIFYLLFIH